MTGCTALRLPSQGDPGVVHLLSVSRRRASCGRTDHMMWCAPAAHIAEYGAVLLRFGRRIACRSVARLTLAFQARLRAGRNGREGARLLDRRDRWTDEAARGMNRADVQDRQKGVDRRFDRFGHAVADAVLRRKGE